MESAIIHTPTHAYSPALAETIASDMRSNDPDWSYTVIHDPTGAGLSIILIHDEDGEFVAQV